MTFLSRRYCLALLPGKPVPVSAFQLFMLFLLTAIVLLVTIEPAFAQATGGAGSFSCSNGNASGTLYDPGYQCPTAMTFENVFSFLVCNIEHLSSNLMGKMFCGMIYSLTPAISAVLVLATLFFGIGFTTGIIPATARDFQSFLLKVAFVWTFATQSDYLIGIGYRGLIDGLRDGVAIALANYNPSGATATGADIYGQLDKFLSVLIHFATDYIGAGKNATDGSDCKNALFAVLAIMAIAFPPIFFLALALLTRIAITFVRAVFGYIYALVGITFLMTLAPFFLSFYLFKQTRNFFEKWLGYMVSFALQIVILFAFLSFILAIDVSEATGNFTDLIVKVKETNESTSFRAPWEYCSLCDFEVVDSTTNKVIPPAEQQSSAVGNAKLRCKTPATALTVLSSVAPPGKKKNGTSLDSQQATLFKYAGGNFMGLLVLAYIIEALLGSVGSLAQVLASGMGGATFAPQLGGGWSMGGRPAVDMPGNELYEDFDKGMTRGFGTSNNGIGAAAAGFKEGMAQMITGRGEQIRPGQQFAESGLKNRFIDWLADPNNITNR